MFYQVRPNQVSDWLAQFTSQQPMLLDVREHWECHLVRLPDDARFEQVFIPMGDVPARHTELSPERPILCLCHHGARSMRVAAYLAQQGFAHVANVTGGIDAWADECDASIGHY